MPNGKMVDADLGEEELAQLYNSNINQMEQPNLQVSKQQNSTSKKQQ